jgi:hypothetical protein
MSRGRFKRMVIGLPQGMGNLSAVQAATDLAEFLQIDLLAAFIADTALLNLAEFPATRELCLLDQQWRPLDIEQISRDLEQAAEPARRRFAESVGSRTIKTGFDVLAGIGLMDSLIEAGDILTIIEPSHPGESITRQFTALLDAAFETAAAILVVPRRIARVSGPIMALAGGPDDASIRVALEIAAALKERLIVVAPPGAPLPTGIAADAQQLGVTVEQLAENTPTAEACPPLPLTSRSLERLRVITRRFSGELLGDVSQLFSLLHGVPLLVIDGRRAETAESKDGVKSSLA